MLIRLLSGLCLCIPMTVIAAETVYVDTDDVALKYGRTVWMSNCENCHGYGTADAPIPMQPDDWRHRVTKSTTTLYRHAIDGYIGPDYSMMPARGGNEELSDDEVMAAVDYMLFLARHYIEMDKQYIQSNRGDL